MQRTINLLLVCCCACAAFPREEYRRDFQKTVPLAAGSVFRIEHSLGSIRIHGQAKNEVNISATIRCSAENAADARRYADAIQIHVEAGPGVIVRTEYPRNNFFMNLRNMGYSVNYDIAMPESSPLELRNSFGMVIVTGLRAGSLIHNSNDRVEFSNGRGRQRIENSFGAVTVSSNDGDVIIDNSNGRVEARDITGALEIRNRFGAVRAANIGRTVMINGSNCDVVEVLNPTGVVTVSDSFGRVLVSQARSDVTVHNQNGPVDVTDAGGAADLRTTFGKVHFARIGGTVGVTAQNSDVTGDTVGSSATITTSFGSVDVRGVKGSLRASANNSPIRLSSITGEVFAHTTFNGVTVEDAGGPVTVEDQNGSVIVISRSIRACQPLILHNTFGPIRVTIPPGMGYNLAARTTFGSIQSQPPMTVNGRIGGQEVNGRINGGGCDMRLMNQNGDIEILN